MYSNCSTTAQRGALDWKGRFRAAVLPVFNQLYRSVKTGRETARVISACSRKNYQKLLARELTAMGNLEMWRAGKTVRSLRPREKARAITGKTAGVAGRTMG
jgi:ketol-acid reductoisomerase